MLCRHELQLYWNSHNERQAVHKHHTILRNHLFIYFQGLPWHLDVVCFDLFWIFSCRFLFRDTVLGPKILSAIAISLAFTGHFFKRFPYTILLMFLEDGLPNMTWASRSFLAWFNFYCKYTSWLYPTVFTMANALFFCIMV